MSYAKDRRDGLSIDAPKSKKAIADAGIEKGMSWKRYKAGAAVWVRLPHMPHGVRGVRGTVVASRRSAACVVVEVDLGTGPTVWFAADRIRPAKAVGAKP